MTEVAQTTPHHLDDVMLAMDVVDTLRHDRALAARDMASVERREDLIARLRGIYKAQGINVPDDVLLDGVKALEEQRFAYAPPKAGLGTSLARLYIRRRKWLPLLYTIAFIIGSLGAVNYVGFVRPAQVQADRVEKLLKTELPMQLEQARDKAIDLAETQTLKTTARDIYAAGEIALVDKNITAAETAVAELNDLGRALGQSYQLRIVSRYGEASGIYLDSLSDSNVRNFYLIVEAVDATGNVLRVNIEDERDKITEAVTKFGVRVPQSVFNAVAADKRDDQIIQDDILGRKERGVLTPQLKFDGPVGYIVEW